MMLFHFFQHKRKKFKELTFWELFWVARGVLLVVLFLFILAAWMYRLLE